MVTVRANPYSESGYGVFRSWEGGGTQYLENEKVDTYQPEVTFVMPDKAVRLQAKYSTNSAKVQEAMEKTRLIVDMGSLTNVSDSIYLAVPQYRGISCSWWEGDEVGTVEQKLPGYASFDPSKTYTVKVTLTANDGVQFPRTPEVTAAKWLSPNKEFAITRDKLTVDAEKKTITFELHLFKRLALTLLPVGVLALEEADDVAPAEAGELSLPDEEVPSISVEFIVTSTIGVGGQSDAELLEG